MARSEVLTEESVQRMYVDPGAADLMKSDRASGYPNLWFRVRNGKARWYLQWRDDDGRQRRLALGDYPKMKLTAARARAKAEVAKVGTGSDPHAEKKARKEEAERTFGKVVDLYLRARRPLAAGDSHLEVAGAKPRLKPRSYQEVERHLTKHAAALKSKPIERVTVADVAELVDGLAEQSLVVADAVRTSLNALFVWAMKKGQSKQNPVARTESPIDRSQIERDRTLMNEELQAIWTNLRDDDHGRAIRLLALLGQRRSEVGGMAWSEIDGLVWKQAEREGEPDQLDVSASAKVAVWTIPAERSKNRNAHAVPLSQQSLDVLAGVDRSDDRDLLFGRRGPFSGWSKAKAALDERITIGRASQGARPLAGWRLHDLRRTLATKIDEELGVMPHVVEAILNHLEPIQGPKLGKTAKNYNRSRYLPEKRQALAVWGEHLLAIVEGRKSNVVPLRKGIAA